MMHAGLDLAIQCRHLVLLSVTLSCAPPLPAVVWDTLRAACDMDVASARLILEAAAITVATADMTTCYDERGE